jgi:hypothetical protein
VLLLPCSWRTQSLQLHVRLRHCLLLLVRLMTVLEAMALHIAIDTWRAAALYFGSTSLLLLLLPGVRINIDRRAIF